MTAAESKATYEEIRECVLEHTGLKVSNLYTAQVKQKRGIIERIFGFVIVAEMHLMLSKETDIFSKLCKVPLPMQERAA